MLTAFTGSMIVVIAEPLIRKWIDSHKLDPETGEVPPEAMVSVVCAAAISIPVGEIIFAWTCTPNVHWIAPILVSPFTYSLYVSILGRGLTSHASRLASRLALVTQRSLFTLPITLSIRTTSTQRLHLPETLFCDRSWARLCLLLAQPCTRL